MTNQKKIRVGLITQNHFPRFGGMEFCNHFLAQSLNKLFNTTVSVACNTMPDVPGDVPYPYTVYRAKSFSIFTQYLKRKNIEKMIRSENINILHGTMLFGGGTEAVMIGKRFNLPVIVQSHGADVQNVPEINYGVWQNSQYISRVRATLEGADKIIAVSNMNKKMILELGAEDKKIAVIHNGVLYEEIGLVLYEDLRKKYGIKPDDFVILTVGRNRPIKRMDLFFEALSLLKKRKQNIKCICVGPIENLYEHVERCGLKDLVILIGPVPQSYSKNHISPPFPELVNLYRGADLFVSVSYLESFNTSALDALACGTPILITKMQGIRDVIKEEETGYVLNEETPEELARMLAVLREKKQELSEKRRYIRESVSHLAWENIASQVRNIYLEILS